MEQDKEIKHEVAQTYAEDMARVLEDDKVGLIKKMIHGEEEKEAQKNASSPEARRNKFFMWASLFLICATIGMISLFAFKKTTVPVSPVEQQSNPIIFTDQSKFIEVAGFTREQIIQSIINEANATTVKDGGVEAIYLTENKTTIGLRRFITLIKSSFMPGDKALVSDDFLMGVVNGDTKDFFILLKVRSNLDIFNALRTWENKIFTDLGEFFGMPITPATQYLTTADFTDQIIANKNARILYDTDNKIVFMYVFADDNSVIITNTANAANEIMLRLASSQVKK